MTVQAERVEALWPFDLSVKLPAALVQQAREAAQPLRRCVAAWLARLMPTVETRIMNAPVG